MTMAERHSPISVGWVVIVNCCVFRKRSGAIAELTAEALRRRRPAAVYLGFLQLVTTKTAVLLGRFLDIFVSVRENLPVHALMNVFLRNESDE